MIEFISNNLASVVIGFLLIVIIGLIIASMVKRFKSQPKIGSGCQGCPNKPYCHRKSRYGCEKNTSKKN